MTQTVITIAVCGLALGLLGWVTILYFRPPNGDTEPLSEEALIHYKRAEGRQGDTGCL